MGLVEGKKAYVMLLGNLSSGLETCNQIAKAAEDSPIWFRAVGVEYTGLTLYPHAVSHVENGSSRELQALLGGKKAIQVPGLSLCYPRGYYHWGNDVDGRVYYLLNKTFMP